MWLKLRKGLFPASSAQDTPNEATEDGRVEEQNPAIQGPSTADRSGPGLDGAYELTEFVQPSQRELEETHPAYASSL